MNKTVVIVCGLIAIVLVALIAGVTLTIALGKATPDMVVQFLAGNIQNLLTASTGVYLVYASTKVSRQVETVRRQTNGFNGALQSQNDSMVEHLQSLVQPLPVINEPREDAQQERGRHEPS